MSNVSGHDADGLKRLAWTALIYGFPCYELARLRYRALAEPAVANPQLPFPLNTWRHKKNLRAPDSSVVTSANSDLLLSGAWLDLSAGPLRFRLPGQTDRYYSVQLIDFFSNTCAVLAAEKSERASQDFIVAGPNWDGGTPAGIPLIRLGTNAGWALLRILADGVEDLPAARALQNRFAIRPQPGSGRGGGSPVEALSMPVFPLENGDALHFFDVLNAVLTENPPPDQDRRIVEELRAIGVGPSMHFDRGAFSDAELAALGEGLAAGRATLGERIGGADKPHGQWRPPDELVATMRGDAAAAGGDDELDRIGWYLPYKHFGKFGTNYLLRAQFALDSIGALPASEALYFCANTDGKGAPLDGHANYVLRFPADGRPPVDGYWSLTAYQVDDRNLRWFVPNDIRRYSIGDRTAGLQYDADGSLRLLMAHRPPATGIGNWLPVCAGPFTLMLRAFRPRPELLDERYKIPAIGKDG
jgi:hypothetical protein